MNITAVRVTPPPLPPPPPPPPPGPRIMLELPIEAAQQIYYIFNTAAIANTVRKQLNETGGTSPGSTNTPRDIRHALEDAYVDGRGWMQFLKDLKDSVKETGL